ncbi:hypothetical protein YPC_3063 [Yersinia pestis biovar Medievalis str. Harbin 35]|nr:hypothetical protein YPC_3063 [Yersinia pestis biovar Medievalis str. Harbin 35]EEO77707.1 hypothetical protein YP516_1387 [Yersinia pestis Nepal516]EEO80037.1 hypothetical protein YPF_3469 [Yersinia pestis biovar Orientalis str. India 195]EEO84866.1 hypothetical protein YPH_0691 [Yersinia pestis biovar Orientalis str. PEXU2]EEO89940.1 hypothetical protein YPS_2942 [Yersinia pestis Pestoides A]
MLPVLSVAGTLPITSARGIRSILNYLPFFR